MNDIHNWSGTGYNIAKALEQQKFQLTYINKLKSWPNYILRIKSMYYANIFNKVFDFHKEPLIAKQFAKQIFTSLRIDTDVVFSPSSTPLAFLETNKPKVFYTDATFASMVGFYNGFSNYCNETIKHGNEIEQKALESSSLAIYSSKWAALSAINHYNVNPNKVKVVPFGANIECNRTLYDIKQLIAGRQHNECHLLFLGQEWTRKGGEMSLKVAGKLNSIGLKTFLHVVGLRNSSSLKFPDYVINHGFLSKTNTKENALIHQLFSLSHFFILPTIADCTPIVFAEANSYGLPCISTNVGGISTLIKNEINGKLFSILDSEEKYVQYILEKLNNRNAYEQLCYSSFNEYEQRLNWNVAGRSISSLLKQL